MRLTQEHDDLWAGLLRNVEGSAFSSFYGSTWNQAFGYALSVLRDPDVADDAVQGAYAELWEALVCASLRPDARRTASSTAVLSFKADASHSSNLTATRSNGVIPMNDVELNTETTPAKSDFSLESLLENSSTFQYAEEANTDTKLPPTAQAALLRYTNRSIDRLRKSYLRDMERRVDLEVAYTVQDGRPLCSELLLQEEAFTQLRHLALYLPEDERVAFVLYFFEGLSHFEIGDLLAVERSVISKRIARAVERLRGGALNFDREYSAA
jgi:RNA polymerase sigma factor (sigma-70 family)